MKNLPKIDPLKVSAIPEPFDHPNSLEHMGGIHVESVAGVVSATDAWEPFADLSAAELGDLGEDCKVLLELKSGPSCTCGPFD